ncbi:MAG: lmo0937 family membrane protein [Burkholderiales bacterium]|nr:lmo0937 family membrane protein [Bacteroidia bacterium]
MYSFSNLLYFIGILSGAIWAIGFFIYNSGNVIHIFLAISVIAIILRIIRGRDSKEAE